MLRGPTLRQLQGWGEEIVKLQEMLHRYDTPNPTLQMTILRSMLNILEDLVESFKESPSFCRKCGRHFDPRVEGWEGICQACFDRIVHSAAPDETAELGFDFGG